MSLSTFIFFSIYFVLKFSSELLKLNISMPGHVLISRTPRIFTRNIFQLLIILNTNTNELINHWSLLQLWHFTCNTYKNGHLNLLNMLSFCCQLTIKSFKANLTYFLNLHFEVMRYKFTKIVQRTVHIKLLSKEYNLCTVYLVGSC